MTEPVIQDLPIVILSCQVFQHWLENLLPDLPGWRNNITFFDYGLHRVPKNLRLTIQEAITSIAEPSLIMLGYGLCGNGLNNINSGIHYLLIPRSDDCISMLLGSYQAYHKQITSEPGTYYLSKGWLESGSNPLSEYQELVLKYGAEKAEWLMDYQYHNYKRLVMVARNQLELEYYREKALEVAEYCTRWGMRYEEIIGTDGFLEQLVEITANPEKINDDFILVPPGSKLTQSQFIRGY